MPITKGAIRKQRADKKKARANLVVRKSYKEAVSRFRRSPTAKNLSTLFRRLDRAAKSAVIHRNLASRLKSRLSRLVKSK